jgi:hypothetical protein
MSERSATRNMSAHDKIFAAAAAVADDFANVTGEFVAVDVFRLTEKRNARALFDVVISRNGFETAARAVTMEEAVFFLRGAAAILSAAAHVPAADVALAA